MAFALVTPASRGIGNALTRHLLTITPSSLPIIATARDNVSAVREQILASLPPSTSSSSVSDRLDVVQCDVESESSISSLADHIKDKYASRSPNAHLRLGFCIPGMLVPERAPEKIDYDSALQTLKLNLLSPMMLAKHLSPFLPRKSAKLDKIEGLNDSAILAFMSARVGSISDNRRGGWYSYRSSKAGVNQLVRSLDIHLQMRSAANAMSIALHPGTVKTGLSKEFWETTPTDKLFAPDFAAEQLVDVARDLPVEQGRGRCWDWKGEQIMP